MRKRGLVLFLVVAALSGVVLWGAFWHFSTSPFSLVLPRDHYHFSLVDHEGNLRTETDFSQPYKLVYFGFTYCPLICPTELQKMAEAYLKLSRAEQKLIQPLFISVDPERDTPDVLKNYVDLFLPNLMGLTGSVEQVEAAKKAYGVFSRKVPEGEDYTVDHSSFTYLIGPNDQLLAQFKATDSSATLAARIQEEVSLHSDGNE